MSNILPNKEKVRNRIADLRKEMTSPRTSKTGKPLKMSQADLAESIGCSLKSLQLYELETQPIPSDILVKLAAFFHVSTDYILGLDSSRHVGNAEIAERTGLTEDNIEGLAVLQECAKHNNYIFEILCGLNYLINDAAEAAGKLKRTGRLTETIANCVYRYLCAGSEGNGEAAVQAGLIEEHFSDREELAQLYVLRLNAKLNNDRLLIQRGEKEMAGGRMLAMVFGLPREYFEELEPFYKK